ncbi:MAG TPA: polysaccharide deacetylase family protein [Burkholderiaceae bacterium]|nr:polysaccharide deacetylase family protein [Burkholderiaceae bacterium]
MRWIRDWFRVLPLAEAAARLKSGDLPPRAMSITFDDGYADNEEVAAPILRRLGLHATFFVATGFLDGGNMWNDRVIEAVRACNAQRLDLGFLALGIASLDSMAARRATIDRILARIKHEEPAQRQAFVERIEEACGTALQAALMMRAEQVARLAASGMDIGAHTVTHPILARLSLAQAREEIESSKAALESIVGRRVALFAYPNGVPQQDYRAEHVELVRTAGFDAAVCTAWGVARPGADPFQLPRFTPWDRTRPRFALRLARNLSHTRYATA